MRKEAKGHEDLPRLQPNSHSAQSLRHGVPGASPADAVPQPHRYSPARPKNPDFTKIPYGFTEFPKATLADWQKAAGTTARWQSPEGIAHRGVYTPADANTAHAGRLPGIPPFLGGPYATMFAQKPWTIRQYAGFSTAEKTSTVARKFLDRDVTLCGWISADEQFAQSIADQRPIALATTSPAQNELRGLCAAALAGLPPLGRRGQTAPAAPVRLRQQQIQ